MSWSRRAQIAELAELERELAPDLVGLGRFLGLSAKRAIELARALDVRTADELREAAADGPFAQGAGDRRRRPRLCCARRWRARARRARVRAYC